MKLTIELTKDNRVNFSQDKPVPFATFSLALFSVMLGFANTLVDNVPEKYKKIAKEQIYDAINVGASNVLATFAPEIEARPNLTVEAILAAEDKIIASKTAEQLHEEYDGLRDESITCSDESTCSAESAEPAESAEIEPEECEEYEVEPAEEEKPASFGGDTSVRDVPKMPRQIKVG